MSKKRRGLRPEEAALWDRVASTARPMNPARKPAFSRQDSPDPPKEPKSIPQFRVGQSAPDRRTSHMLQPALTDRLASQKVQMDRKAFMRMSRGKLKPEAKIDLHGMTLAQAHPALTRFILSAQADGRRLVLVVTGKGRDRDDGGPIPAPRGILKHQVPMWLAQPPLVPLVLQITEAHQRHGGGGAYYVYLRRPIGSGR